MKSLGTDLVVAHAYDVIYTPEKSGSYEILFLCGNIPLKGGEPLKKEVKAGNCRFLCFFTRTHSSKVPNSVLEEIYSNFTIDRLRG